MTKTQKNILNIIVFNAVWLVCVLGGSKIAVIALVITLLFHMKVISGSRLELAFIGFVALLGVVLEFAFVQWGR